MSMKSEACDVSGYTEVQAYLILASYTAENTILSEHVF